MMQQHSPDLRTSRMALEIFEDVVHLPREERERRLGRLTDLPHEVMTLVRALLEADAAPVREASASSPADSADERTLIGERVGPFTLLRRIGEGGMGVVYEAEQDVPSRRVAVKLLRDTLSTSAERRFRYEIQALAMLEHKNIAKLFEAGTWSSTGVPYFAMEFVRGAMPITKYAVDARLSLGERLRLFHTVCEAVAHGHRKSIIHCDIKSENVLVDEDGRVRVVDFGIARSLNVQPVSDSIYSGGTICGTLATMAPEQLGLHPGAPDTRTDVYGLGLLLFALVTERPAYDLRGLSLFEAIDVLSHRSVPAPSSVLAGSPRALDWIVAKSIDPDPDRRYGSVADLADDVRRLRANEPLSVGPAGAMYRVGLFVRRNRMLAGSVAAVLIAVAIGTAGTAYGLVREAWANQRAENAETSAATSELEAEQHAANASRILEFFFALSQHTDLEGRQLSLGEALGHVLDTDPHTLALVGDTTARYLQEAWLARLLQAAGRMEDAERLQSSALEGLRDVLGPEDARTLEAELALGHTLFRLSRYGEAEPFLRHAEAGLQRQHGDAHRSVVLARKHLGATLQHVGRLQEAKELMQAAHDGSLLLPDEDPLLRLGIEYNLAVLMGGVGASPAETEALYRKILEEHERVLAPNHPQTLRSQIGLAEALVAQGRFQEAEPLVRDALGRALGSGNDEVALGAQCILGILLLRSGRTEEAEVALSACSEAHLRRGSEAHPESVRARTELAHLYLLRREPEKAEPLLRELLSNAVRLPTYYSQVAYLATSLRSMKRLDEAVALLSDALDEIERAPSPWPSERVSLLIEWGCVQRDREQWEPAANAFADVVAALDDMGNPLNAPHRATIALEHAKALCRLERHADALEVLKAALAKAEADLGPSHASTAAIRHYLDAHEER